MTGAAVVETAFATGATVFVTGAVAEDVVVEAGAEVVETAFATGAVAEDVVVEAGAVVVETAFATGAVAEDVVLEAGAAVVVTAFATGAVCRSRRRVEAGAVVVEVEAGAVDVEVGAEGVVAVTGATADETTPVALETSDELSAADALAVQSAPTPKARMLTAIATTNLRRAHGTIILNIPLLVGVKPESRWGNFYPSLRVPAAVYALLPPRSVTLLRGYLRNSRFTFVDTKRDPSREWLRLELRPDWGDLWLVSPWPAARLPVALRPGFKHPVRKVCFLALLSWVACSFVGHVVCYEGDVE